MKRTKAVAIFLVCVLLMTLPVLTGCSKKTAPRPQLNTDFSGSINTMAFSAQPSEQLTLSGVTALSVSSVIAQQAVEYPYAELYQLNEVKNRLDIDATVQNHRFSALDETGVLTVESLRRCVKANNETFMEEKPFGYTSVEDDYIDQLCDFIVKVIGAMEEKYPDIDWPRVYCNLGNLKILYDVGMLSYAQVSSELVLSISKNNTQIILTLKGEDGFSRVLTHEIMHIIQIGCVCENIENCSRRAGIALYWDDFSLNTTDWTWMVEGSAERNMCKLTGGKAVSYQYKMDYLCSLTMSVLLRDSVKADTMDTMCFYSDPELLFEAFGCESQQQRDELLNMMITLQVLQMQPKSFHIAYKEKTGVDLLEDQEAMDQFSYALKPAICITLAKEFYENLTCFLQEQQMTCNDLFFLINLFEGHLNQHLTFTNEAKAELNRPFINSYCAMREALFSALEQDNPGLDVTALYKDYKITGSADHLLNAALDMLTEDKRSFLAERAQWQAELGGLGQKVP